MNQTTRLFLALPVYDFFSKEMNFLEKEIKSHIQGAKWADFTTLHLTLHFFGNTPNEQIPHIREIVGQAMEDWKPVKLSLKGIGFFPHAKMPRVMWLGISEQSTPMVEKLYKHVSAHLAFGGFEMELRGFKPHVTLARINPEKPIQGDISKLSFDETEVRKINRLVLYESVLSSEGAQHKEYEVFSFGG